MGAPIGQTGAGTGPYDPRKKEVNAWGYFKAVQADLNKRYGKKGKSKKSSPKKEK